MSLRRLMALAAVAAVGAAMLALAPAPASAQPESFEDVPEDAYYSAAVADLAATGVLAGTECAQGFCPGDAIDRKTMAVWVVRIRDKADPPAVPESRFGDVDAAGFHARFVERMAELGVTGGCGDGTNYCPDRSVTRAQMAVFLSRAFNLPDGPDPGFGDVPTDAWFTADVARLAASGITAGCGDGTNYCPDRDTTRAQMAAFLTRGLDFAERAATAKCRPRGIQNSTVGFPLPSWTLSAIGEIQVAVLFLDFPNAPAAHSTRQDSDSSLTHAEAYLEEASYGKLDVVFSPLRRWLRAEHNFDHYNSDGRSEWDGERWATVGVTLEAEAVRLADPQLDFSPFDMVLVVLPSSHFWSGHAGVNEDLAADGKAIQHAPVVNSTAKPDWYDRLDSWGEVAAHEMAHSFGLADLYPHIVVWPPLPNPTDWIRADFGLFGLSAYYPANGREPVWEPYHEMLAWSRWQLDWLTAAQVRCITEDEATIALRPVTDPADGTAMAAVPLTDTEIIVIENRNRSNGAAGPAPSEGVLVYTVDSTLGSGELPLAVAGDTGNGRLDRPPLLNEGQSMSVRGYDITVTSATPTTRTVTITKSG